MNLASITYKTEIGDLLDAEEAIGILDTYIQSIEKSASEIRDYVKEWCDQYKESFVIDDNFMLWSFFSTPYHNIGYAVDNNDVKTEAHAKIRKREDKELRTLQQKVQDRIDQLKQSIIVTERLVEFDKASPKALTTYRDELKEMEKKLDRVTCLLSRRL